MQLPQCPLLARRRILAVLVALKLFADAHLVLQWLYIQPSALCRQSAAVLPLR